MILAAISVLASYRCDKDHDQKQLEEDKVCFGIQVAAVHHEGKSKQELTHRGTGIETDTMESHCLLDSSSRRGFLRLLFYKY